MFLRNTCNFADLADSKFWPIALSAKSDRKISKKFLVNVSDILCMNQNKCFEKLQNDKI